MSCTLRQGLRAARTSELLRGMVGNLTASRSPCRRVLCARVVLACSSATPSCCLACSSSSVMREHTPSCKYKNDQDYLTLQQ